MEPLANREVELKFRIPQGDLSRIEKLPELQGSLDHAVVALVSTVYFDTPDQDLWKKGFSLRIRKTGERYIETIKQETSSIIARGEWEKETNSATLDFSHAETTPLAPLIGKRRVKTELRPAFEVHLERRIFPLAANGAEIEAVIDTGHIEADGKSLPISELELELKSGDRTALFDLARTLTAQSALGLGFLGKAERGFRLADGSAGRAAKASKPRLCADMSCREAFQEICRICLHDLGLNAEAFEGTDHVEGVHQARIAIRRARAALTLFNPIFRDPIVSKTISGELKWLAGLLGTARDLDVMLLEAPQLGNGSVRDDMEARRAAAHRAIRDGFTSPRYRTFLVDFVAWIETDPRQVEQGEPAESPVADFVIRRLRKRRKQLVVSAQGLAGLEPTARHKIRIEAKKLRYMAEFFLDVPEVAERRNAYKKLIEACENLQEALGAMHDIEVREAFHANKLVGELALADAEDRGESSAGYVEAAAADTSRQLARAIEAYERLAATRPF
jgi:triphosphatase